MKSSILVVVACAVCVVLLAQPMPDSKTREIVIRGVNVIPMDREVVLTDQTIIIRNEKIVSVGKGLKPGKGALIIEGKGKYIIPGLAEMHAHVPPVDAQKPMEDVLKLFALNGVTTIRGMLGHPQHLVLRQHVRDGSVWGPQLFTTGPSFNGFSVTSPEAGADMVKNQKDAGYDYLKLHPGLTREKFDAIAHTAKEVNIPYVGHVSFGVGVWHAINSDYNSIDHLDGFIEGMVPGIEEMVEAEAGLFGMLVADRADTSRIPQLMSELKAHQVWVVPTQALAERWFNPSYTIEQFNQDPNKKYMDTAVVGQWTRAKQNLHAGKKYDPASMQRFIQLRRKLIRACDRAGVGLLLGCDAPQVFNVPGFSTHLELQYLVKAGLSPYRALRTGTIHVGEYLNDPLLGVVKPGAHADLLLVEGNPLDDISNTQKIAGVLLRGKWISKEFIRSELKKLEKQ